MFCDKWDKFMGRRLRLRVTFELASNTHIHIHTNELWNMQMVSKKGNHLNRKSANRETRISNQLENLVA